jgi:PadR family transcriptional regulator PadR
VTDVKNVETVLKSWAKEYKKGFISYFILLFLKERPMYGFEISKQLMGITDSGLIFQESGIYQILKNLQKNGMVSFEWQKSSKGPQRKCYIISDEGNDLLERFTKEYLLPILNTSFKLVKTHFPDLEQIESLWESVGLT